MFTSIWVYDVGLEQRERFIEAYGPEGAWAALFRCADGYGETMLLHDVAHAERFVTLDRWTSRAAHDAFRAGWAAAYTALDAATEVLTRSEAHLGSFES